ncbi:hypothetical protein EGW08_019435 [Elysia chlorotica]|uniref:Uncharacterized protein n=1 Tax=Elysia chlorotica TaxID=188477 RepID=A0A3S0ZDY8_ELYCH|nr:hypothetical protein EGW08_019435 [Elysia chlorotica]
MSNLSTDFEDDTSFSQTWDPSSPLLLVKSVGAEQKETDPFDSQEFGNSSKCNPKGQSQFQVTDEFTGPKEIDSDLTYDYDSAVPDRIFDTRVDIHRARRFWQKGLKMRPASELPATHSQQINAAEAFALCMAFDTVSTSREDIFCILSDSLSLVELQILGPFPFKRSHSQFVVAALDSFSKWPEVQAMEIIDEKTVSRFCLKLIARYGLVSMVT